MSMFALFIFTSITGHVAAEGSLQAKFEVLNTSVTFSEASLVCARKNSKIVTADTAEKANEVLDSARQAGYDRVWLNAKETVYPWKWILEDDSNATEYDQGCLMEAALDSFEAAEVFSGMTTKSCLENCGDKGKRFAALRTLSSSRQQGSGDGECRCGNTLREGNMADILLCEQPCPGDRRDNPFHYCGEHTATDLKYRVLAVFGVKSALHYKVGTGTENNFCGALFLGRTSRNSEPFAMKKEHCSQKHQYICFTTNTTSAHCDFQFDNQSCYRIMNSSESWFDARMKCKEIEADLAFVNRTIAERLRDANALIQNNAIYWTGLHGSHWLWDNDPHRPLVYNAWDSQEPNSSRHNCLVMDSSTGKWNDDPCDDNNYFFCEKAATYTVDASSFDPTSVFFTDPSIFNSNNTNGSDYSSTNELVTSTPSDDLRSLKSSTVDYLTSLYVTDTDEPRTTPFDGITSDDRASVGSSERQHSTKQTAQSGRTPTIPRPTSSCDRLLCCLLMLSCSNALAMCHTWIILSLIALN